MMSKYKIIIPNILTLSRLILTPIIIILGLTKNYNIALILIVFACITDMFDGKLARKWNTVSETGAKLDCLSDKIFAIGLIMCLINKYKFFILLVIMECLIGLLNLIMFFKTNKCNSLMIGKIKTTILFITISLGFFSLFNNIFDKFILGLIFATINIQVLSFINYILYYYDLLMNKKVEKSIINDKKNTRTKTFNASEYKKKIVPDIESDTKVLNNIKDIFKND